MLLRISVFIIASVLAVFICLYFEAVPVKDIWSLKKSFVHTKIKGDDPHYSIRKTKPKSWVELKDLSPTVYNSFVVSEDWRFYDHQGLDVVEVKGALKHWLKGNRLRGASTITQQVAKNLFLTHKRSFLRKFREAMIALTLDAVLGKKRILEIYINIIQYGHKLYGIESAAKYYFKIPATKLQAREGAFLAMLLPSPVRYGQSFREQDLTQYASKIINSILHRLKVARFINKDELLKQRNRRFDWERSESCEIWIGDFLWTKF